MATMADLDELALAMPQVAKEVQDGRPSIACTGRCSASTVLLRIRDLGALDRDELHDPVEEA